MIGLADGGIAPSTRAEYLQIFKNFHVFVAARFAVEIGHRFGVMIIDPVDAFNRPVNVGVGAGASRPPPSVERLDEFFGFMRDQIATARKYYTASRDYTIFRVLYHTGLRSDEAARLAVSDVHLDRGPFGKLHVRFGKGTRTGMLRRFRTGWLRCLGCLVLFVDFFRGSISKPRVQPLLIVEHADIIVNSDRSNLPC